MPSRKSVRRERRWFRPLRLEPLAQLVLPGFLAPLTYDAGSSPSAVAVGDFNGDGKQDLAVANYYSANVSVLLGKGDGTFLPAVNYAAGVGPDAVAVGDFNGDGKPDLAVANLGTYPYYSDSSVSVLLGNGDGTFQAAQNFPAGPAGDSPRSVAVGDFNGDDTPDLAVANFDNPTYSSDGSVSVLLGNGDGTFQPPVDHAAGGNPQFVAVGDFNGDGKQDLVAVYGAGGVSVLLGKGDGTFLPGIGYLAGSGPVSVAVGDFNGDGTPDLAVANTGSANVSVLLDKGDGTFQAAVNYAAGKNPQSVAVGDFNGDGILDLAVADAAFSTGTPGVSVLLGNGDGTFQAPHTYAAGPHPYSVAVGDFNGDVAPDLAVLNSNVSILLNDNSWPGAPRPGGQPPGDGRAAAAAVEPRAAPAQALPPVPGVLPTDAGMAVLGSPGAVTVPGPSHLRFGVDADQGPAAAAPAPGGAASPEASVGGALTGGPPALALLDRLFAEPTSGWGGDLLGEQPWSSTL
jgi:hypothetical protein